MNNVFQFGSCYRVFCWPWFRHWFSPRTYYRPFLYAYQRAVRGWADRDTWSVDSWLCGVLPPAIEHLREHTHGYPCGLTEEKWDSILSEIAEGFRAAERSKDTPEEFVIILPRTPQSVNYGVPERVYNWDKIKAYQESELAKFHKGMKLFVKYFQNLWD